MRKLLLLMVAGTVGCISAEGTNHEPRAGARAIGLEEGEDLVGGLEVDDEDPNGRRILGAVLDAPPYTPQGERILKPSDGGCDDQSVPCAGLQGQVSDEITDADYAPPIQAQTTSTGFGYGVSGNVVYSSNTDIDPYTTTAMFVTDPKIEIRINHNADSVSESLIPELFGPSLVLNLGDFKIAGGFLPDVPFLSLLLSQCHLNTSSGSGPTGGLWDLNINNVRITPAIDGNSLDIHFETDKTIETAIELPRFNMTFEIEFFSPHDDNAYCNSVGSDYRVATTVTINGLTGNLDATVDSTSIGGLDIETITSFNAEVGTVSLSSTFLTNVATYGLILYDLFGGSCNSLNSCVDQEMSSFLESSDGSAVKNEIKSAMNDALNTLTTINGAANLGVAQVDYTVRLDSIATSESRDRLRTQWDVDYSTNRANGACASMLQYSHFMAPLNVQTQSDLDVLIPYRKITDLLYVIARTGELCAPIAWNGTTLNIKPTGYFNIIPLTGNSFKATLPVRVEALIPNVAWGFISGRMEVTMQLTPNCSAITMTATAVNLTSLTGAVNYVKPNGVEVSMSLTTFINSHKGPVEAAILAKLQPPQTVTPGTFGLEDLGHYLSYGPVYWGASEVTFGLELLEGSCP
jgi:hypothetical protein